MLVAVLHLGSTVCVRPHTDVSTDDCYQHIYSKPCTTELRSKPADIYIVQYSHVYEDLQETFTVQFTTEFTWFKLKHELQLSNVLMRVAYILI